MDIVIKIVKKIAYNPWFAIFSGLASIISLLWVAYGEIITGSIEKKPLIIFILSLVFFSITLFYSIKLRVENRSLRNLAQFFHEVNHLYRDNLRQVFNEDCPITDRNQLLGIEKNVLREVCQIISRAFSNILGGKEVMITIKLLVPADSGGRIALTYVRSMESSRRDGKGQVEYMVDNGSNTALDEALKVLSHGISHYYSPNLKKDEKNKKYSNQRQGYEHYYRSTIVVPIRAKTNENKGVTDDVGFLTIDTKAVNCLNGGYHVEMMAAFADQMYNFIALMRGRYMVLVDE